MFHRGLAARLEKKGQVTGMRSLPELAQYYREKVDPLWTKISSEGLRRPSWYPRIDPMYAYIGRDGEIIWGPGGNHRLAIAKSLELDTIPVRVHLRHSDWQEIREQVAEAGRVAKDPRHRNHPDLADLRDPWMPTGVGGP